MLPLECEVKMWILEPDFKTTVNTHTNIFMETSPKFRETLAFHNEKNICLKLVVLKAQKKYWWVLYGKYRRECSGSRSDGKIIAGNAAEKNAESIRKRREDESFGMALERGVKRGQ